MRTDGDTRLESRSPEALLKEDDLLVIGSFDELAIRVLGRSIADQALASRQPLAASVRPEKREVFRAALPGSPVIDDVVLDAKYRTAARGGQRQPLSKHASLARFAIPREGHRL